jgi:alpha-mannosidase
MLTIDNPAVVLTTWKLAEDGQGSILRLVETAGAQQNVIVSSDHLALKKAWTCSVLEDNRSELPVSTSGIALSVGPFEVVTLRVQSEPKLPARAAVE